MAATMQMPLLNPCHDGSKRTTMWLVPTDEEVGRRIRAAAGYAGLSQPALADKIGYSTTQLGRWWRGQSQPPRQSIVDSIAAACGVPTSFFTTGFSDAPQDARMAEALAELEDLIRRLRSTDQRDDGDPPPSALPHAR